MKTSRRPGALDVALFVLIFVAAAGVRAWYVSTCCQQGTTEGPFQAQDDWSAQRDDLVGNLKSGNGFTARAPLAAGAEKTAHTAYLYPCLLSLLDRPANDLALTYQRMRWIQVGLGALAAAIYYLIGRRAFQSMLVGFIAGILAAFHPAWIINTGEINDGVVTTFLLAFALSLGVRAGQSGGALTSVLYGLSLAGLASVRAALLPFSLLAALWLLWRSRRLPSGWMLAILTILGFFIGIIPWLTRNFQSFGEVTPVVNSTYLHLWIGNNSRATGGPETESVMRGALKDRGDLDPTELEKIAQSERYRLLAWQIRDEIRADPARACERRLQAGLAFFFGERWLTDRVYCRVDVDPQAKGGIPEWLKPWTTTIFACCTFCMLLLAALGWRWSYGWRRESMPIALAPIWVFLPYLVSHAEAYIGPRLPLDGVFLTYAAFVIACIVPPVGRHLLAGEDADPIP